MTSTRIVLNCYDCPFWDDGASGEYAEECLYDPEAEALPFIWNLSNRPPKKDKTDFKAPKSCPLRKGNVEVMLL